MASPTHGRGPQQQGLIKRVMTALNPMAQAQYAVDAAAAGSQQALAQRLVIQQKQGQQVAAAHAPQSKGRG